MRCADFDKICVFLRSAYGVDLCIFPLRYRHGSADLRSPEETGSGANRRINCDTATGIAAMFHAAAFKIVPPLDNPPDNPSPAPSKSLIDELNEAVSAGSTAQPCAFLNAPPICLPLARAAIPATRSRCSTTARRACRRYRSSGAGTAGAAARPYRYRPPAIIRSLAFDDAIVVAEPLVSGGKS
ncbi:MAG: hypothetical protein WBL55_24070 [Xanthobacteraceae bacterium]